MTFINKECIKYSIISSSQTSSRTSLPLSPPSPYSPISPYYLSLSSSPFSSPSPLLLLHSFSSFPFPPTTTIYMYLSTLCSLLHFSPSPSPWTIYLSFYPFSAPPPFFSPLRFHALYSLAISMSIFLCC